MIVRNVKLIFSVNLLILLSGVVTSLLGAWALGPAGRGDLLVVVLWPPVIALLAGLGLPVANRYWMAREPERVSHLFSNAIIYALVGGTAALVWQSCWCLTWGPAQSGSNDAGAHLPGKYSGGTADGSDLGLMEGCVALGGRRRRALFFGVQALGFLGLWLAHASPSKARP